MIRKFLLATVAFSFCCAVGAQVPNFGGMGVPNGGGGGGSTTSAPNFLAQITSAQTLTSGTPAAILFNSVVKDTNSFYTAATGKFQPTIAGTYRIHGQIDCSATTSVQGCNATISKNGTAFAESLGTQSSASNWPASVDSLVSFNGTTDFVVISVLETCTGTCTVVGTSAPTLGWFEGSFVSP